MNNDKLKENEEKSENEISEITDQAIFQGAISLLNKEIAKPAKQHQQHQSQQSQQGHNDIKEEQNKSKILQNLIKMDPPITAGNNSMYSSGILSFRNKKAYFHNPQFTQSQNQKLEENIDQEAITKSILEKMNAIKRSKKTFGTYVEDSNFKRKMLNNESTKAYEEEYDEKGFKMFNSNSSEDQYNENSNSNENSHSNANSENNNDKENGDESNRIFWQVQKDKDGESTLKHKDSTCPHTRTSESKRRHKYLKQIVCTLSLLEKGKAIFVSQDDMIFILPALFVPKNLNVGNTYVFKVREYKPYSFKSNVIQDIQKKYRS